MAADGSGFVPSASAYKYGACPPIESSEVPVLGFLRGSSSGSPSERCSKFVWIEIGAERQYLLRVSHRHGGLLQVGC